MNVHSRTQWFRIVFTCLTLISILYGGTWWNQKQYYSHPSHQKPLQFDQFEPLVEYGYYIYFLAQQRQIPSVWRFHKQTGEFKQIRVIPAKNPSKSQVISSLLKNIIPSQKNKDFNMIAIAPSGSLYVMSDATFQSVILHDRGLNRSFILPSLPLHIRKLPSPESMMWSTDERYLLLWDQFIIQLADGQVKSQLKGKWGSWSPVSNQLLYVNKQGNLCLLDVESGAEKVVFTTDENEKIWSRPVWDPSGQYFAFGTGSNHDGQMKVEKVHVLDLKLFHYVENEQNLLPTLLTNIQLSPNGTFLLYTVEGMTKIIHLPNQELRVYDGYMQEKENKFPYFRLDQKGVWLASANDLQYIDSSLQERKITRFPAPLVGFYLSEDQRYQLAIESYVHGYRVSVIQLFKKGL